MNLYIESIKLWFKGFSEDVLKTVTYPFKPNKINVITGDSSTGKSSILGIIDYLFLSDNPVIVENIVNEINVVINDIIIPFIILIIGLLLLNTSI